MRVWWVALLCCWAVSVSAQEYTGTTGLLQVPSAEMDSAGAFRVGGWFLHRRFLPETLHGTREPYNSFGYTAGLTVFRWLEISYSGVLLKMHPNRDPSRPLRYCNEDRHVSLKVRPLKEGRWWPSVAVGIDDVGDFSLFREADAQEYNNYFESYYIAASKHVETDWGLLGLHLTYRHYPYAANRNREGLAGGITLRPRFFRPLRFILEWDGAYSSVGADVLLWRHLFAQVCLTDGYWPTVGLSYHYQIPL